MITTYLKTSNKNSCYGCRACEVNCPKGAISMQSDKEGFLYPVLDKDKCIDCSICYNTCPYDNAPQFFMPLEGYALQYDDRERLIQSSSGAAFPAFADYILKQGGYIVGCIFNEDIKAVHVVTNDETIVKQMSGSKYVQSDTIDTYQMTKELLLSDHLVLFSGTPCQIAGLLKYLKKPYENLITVDLICHGVPSPSLLQGYLAATYEGSVLDVKFRDKKTNGWCSQGCVQYRAVNGKIKKNKTSPYTDSYYYYYLQNSISRYCCYECQFSTATRVSDITIGDYWNVRDVMPEFNPTHGVSAVLINSDKGRKILDSIRTSVILKESDIKDIVKGNGNLQKPCDMPPQRNYIYENIEKYGYAEVARQECKYQYVIPFVKKLMPSFIKKGIKKIVTYIRNNNEN